MSAEARRKEKVARPPPPIPANCEALMSRADVANALRVTTRHLDTMVGSGEYPRPDTHIGRVPRWRRETHDSWVRKVCKVQEAAG